MSPYMGLTTNKYGFSTSLHYEQSFIDKIEG
jgi:hypothetical protein